ncbi:MAG: hypothetical protein V4525_05390 [Pseudomonadota bacterium]
MHIPTDIEQLTELFKKFGAKDPELLAESQIKEEIPQLQRFLFLRQAWKRILEEHETDWIQQEIKNSETFPDAPYSGIGLALKKCIQKGIAPQELTNIARGIQAQTLFHLCYLLDAPSFAENELQNFAWGLFAVDENDNPYLPRINALHESVLETDPSGHEMRPQNKS